MHKFILTAALLTAAAFVPATTLAAENTLTAPNTKIAVEASLSTGEDVIFLQGLMKASDKAKDAQGEWFLVTYHSSVTTAVTRNVNNSAESRYVQGDDELIEVEIPVAQDMVQNLTLEFDIGTGPIPDSDHAYVVVPATAPVG